MRPWLQKARDAFRRQTAPVPTPFEIVCPCGRNLVGVRRSESQRLLCTACRERLYILPLDRYPIPVPKAPKFPVAKAQAKSHPAPAAVAPPESIRLSPDEIELVDEGEQIAEAEVIAEEHRPQREAAPKKPGPPPRVIGSSKTPHAAQNATAKEPQDEPLVLRRPRRRIVTPVRVVLVVIVGVVVATVWVGVRRSRLDRAEGDLRVAVQQADEALKAGRFGAAAGALETAVRALDVLGRDDPFARGVRQDRREAGALADLAEVALLDAIEAAAKDSSRAPAVLEGWFLFDAAVRRDSDDETEGSSAVEVEFPFAVGDGPVQLEIGGTIDAALLPEEPGRAARRVFAAQVESIRPPDSQRAHWTVRLRGETAFAWCRGERLATVGMAPEEGEVPAAAAWKKVLEAQAHRAGVGP